jgi:hypothetical protein
LNTNAYVLGLYEISSDSKSLFTVEEKKQEDESSG